MSITGHTVIRLFMKPRCLTYKLENGNFNVARKSFLHEDKKAKICFKFILNSSKTRIPEDLDITVKNIDEQQ